MNEEQELAFSLVKQGKNVFITGSAGTGKSFVLKEIIEHFKEVDEKDERIRNQFGLNNEIRLGIGKNPKYPITSLTGVSSIPINGQTLHSWAGIGLGDGSVNELLSRIKKFRKVGNWLVARALIIDEVS